MVADSQDVRLIRAPGRHLQGDIELPEQRFHGSE
jgi:hypothetical protein